MQHRIAKVQCGGIHVSRSRMCRGLQVQAGHILDHYDEFLRQLDNEAIRDHLGRVSPQQVYRDQQFLELRKASHEFQTALNAVFAGGPPLKRCGPLGTR